MARSIDMDINKIVYVVIKWSTDNGVHDGKKQTISNC